MVFVFSAVKVFEDGQTQGAATFYDYDIHGNVEKLVQKLPELDPKTVEYSYDLLSGNVHRVTYQKGEDDQFMHRYRYDADNRLEAVFTSSDGYIWDEDARYLYYAHGPMARVELGEYKVQGVDYYYTLQGWIKGVNLQGDHDAESTNNVQKYVSKDAFGYALHYYQNDYQSITSNFGWNASSTTDLFNGNIAAMSTTLKTAGEQTMLYRYDQLNRIKTAVSSQNTYQTGYSYDANGNILSLLRNDHNNQTIDNLSYTYNTTQNNRLNKLRDNSGNNTGFTSSSTPFSYQYDNIGNLIEDEEKDITSVKWTVYGKVASVTKNDAEISYKYDATGNRIYKKVVSSSLSKETHYVRDASGNLMATYENKIAKEFVIYGSSRLGIYNGSTSEGKRTLGNKKYELSNHLGNILSVISDNKIGIDSDTDLVADYYEPYIVSESDYYPFGMAMKERSFSNEEYRFGFGGHENSSIASNTYDTEYRVLNTEVCRWFSVDPQMGKFPGMSVYISMGNNPIAIVDEKGDVIKIVTIDPNGKEVTHIYVPGEEAIGNASQKQFINDLNKIYTTGEGKEVISTLVETKNIFKVKKVDNVIDNEFKKNTDEAAAKALDEESKLFWDIPNPFNNPSAEELAEVHLAGGTVFASQHIVDNYPDAPMNSTIALAHELFHAYQYEKYGILRTIEMTLKKSSNGQTNMSEVQAVGFENYIRAHIEQGKYSKQRRSYSGYLIREYRSMYTSEQFKNNTKIWKDMRLKED